MRQDLIASALAVLALGGCSGGATTGGEPDGGRTPSEPPPKTPVSSCSVKSDVALAEGAGTAPAIAYSGGHFAVVWTDLTRGAGDVVLTLVDADGKKIGEHRIAEKSSAEVAPTIASMPGGGFLVAWEEIHATGGALRAARVDQDGALDGAPFTVAEMVSAEAHPDAAPTGKGALLAWTEATGAVVAEIDRDKVGAKMSIPGAMQAALAGGDRGAAVWVAGERVGVARGLAPLPKVVEKPTMLREAPGRANVPRIAAGTDERLAAVWEDARGGPEREAVFFASVDREGRVSREIQISPAGGSADVPDVAWIGDRAAVAYYQYRDGPSSIYLTIVDPKEGRAGAELRVSEKRGARFPRLAWAGGGDLAVTYAERSGPVRLAVVTCR